MIKEQRGDYDVCMFFMITIKVAPFGGLKHL